MIHTMVCQQNGQTSKQVNLAEIGALVTERRNILWLDLEKPTPDERRILTDQFHFHPLAVEDATNKNQRPKIDNYGDVYFLVFYDVDYGQDGHRIDEHELHVFLGRNYLVTVHDEPIAEIAEVAGRFHRDLSQIDRGVGVLLYALLDTIVDHYFSVADRVGEHVADMETSVFNDPSQESLEEIFKLRRELLDLRRAVAPERDVASALARRDLPVVGEATALYFQDLHDHVIRVTDQIDSYRELLSGVLEVYLTMGASRQSEASNDLNKTVRTLTSWSIILMSVTLIAGIYGMNFDPGASPWNMPELNATFGYPGALLAMLLVGSTLATIFKRRGWL